MFCKSVRSLLRHQYLTFPLSSTSHLNSAAAAVPTIGFQKCQLSLSHGPLMSSYYRSRTEESPDKYTDYEKSFEEWKFVEKLFPPEYVPQPPTDPNLELPSGWRAPNLPKDTPYLVRRTKNHQIPVYEKVFTRGLYRFTHIRRVEGDIWKLERDVGEYLQSQFPKDTIITKVLEMNRLIMIQGSYVEQVKEWLLAKGF